MRPRSEGWANGTKLKFNYGQGIKEPSIFDETSSLFALLSQNNGQQTISQFHIRPVGPERSRSFDFGVEHSAWNGRARLGLNFFHNRFTDQIEFLGKTGALQLLGVPNSVAAQTLFGATVNSGATRSLGAETDVEINLGHGFSAHAAYTYLDAEVQRSFSSDALCPVLSPGFCSNPNIPNVLIGAFSPLVGNRPFRRAPHTGSFILRYLRPKYMVSVNGYLVSRRDDSTFASDGFFGNTMLRPTRNWDVAYQ